MTNHTAVVSDADARIRWRDWQMRGAANDLRAASGMRKVMLLIGTGLILWFAVRLA